MEGPRKRGGVAITLPRLLHRDLKRVGSKLETLEEYLRLKAETVDVKAWNSRSERIVQTALNNAATSESRRYETGKRRREEVERLRSLHPGEARPQCGGRKRREGPQAEQPPPAVRT